MYGVFFGIVLQKNPHIRLKNFSDTLDLYGIFVIIKVDVSLSFVQCHERERNLNNCPDRRAFSIYCQGNGPAEKRRLYL